MEYTGIFRIAVYHSMLVHVKLGDLSNVENELKQAILPNFSIIAYEEQNFKKSSFG